MSGTTIIHNAISPPRIARHRGSHEPLHELYCCLHVAVPDMAYRAAAPKAWHCESLVYNP
ncbi:hypothetical protein Hrubri_0182 [Herbaspirillum rubrisubalbicans M1]|nr:hypothetical protein Hrubri_0182 [Herbaspirillum rubrisubalbicans M1]